MRTLLALLLVASPACPAFAADCPPVAGDLAPGTLDMGTDPPTFLDQLRDEAAYWGKCIGTAYGEPFTSREPMGLTSMGSLI